MSKICPMCGAFMKTNICEYCRYEMEVPEEKVQKEPEYEERTIYIQPNIIINNQFTPDESEYTYEETVETVSRKNKFVALLLCLFFGYFVLHHFYVGKIGWGIVYFFTIGLFGLGWFFDFILIAVGHFKDKDGLPLK